MTDELAIRKDRSTGGFRIGYLMKAASEARKLLNPTQYEYCVRVAERLVEWGDPQALTDLRIEPIDTFHELKLKGNVLGRLNMRVYFGVFPDAEPPTIIMLGVIKKEAEHKTPHNIVIRMRNRKRAVAASMASRTPQQK